MKKDAMRANVTDEKEYFNRSTSELAEADSGFAPVEGMFTAAAQVAHAAQVIEWFFDGAFSAGGFDLDFQKHDANVRAVTSLAEARAWFDRACASAHAVIDAKSDEEWAELLPPGPIMGGAPRYAIIGAMMDHTAHHRAR